MSKRRNGGTAATRWVTFIAVIALMGTGSFLLTRSPANPTPLRPHDGYENPPQELTQRPVHDTISDLGTITPDQTRPQQPAQIALVLPTTSTIKRPAPSRMTPQPTGARSPFPGLSSTKECNPWECKPCAEGVHPVTLFRRYVPLDMTQGEREPLDSADLQEMGLKAFSKHGTKHEGWGVGYHCVALHDIALGCVVGTGGMIVLDPSRKSTEYGVRPYELPRLPSATFPSPVTVIMAPKALPNGMQTACFTLLHSAAAGGALVKGSNAVDFVGDYGVGRCEEVGGIPKEDFTPLPTNGLTEPSCRHHVAQDMTVKKLTVSAGCVVTLAEGVILHVTGSLHLVGTAKDPIVWTSSSPKERWRGIIVEEGAVFEMAFVIMSHSGGGKGRPKNTGSHRPEFPAITLVRGSTGGIRDCLLVEGAGPALGIGKANVEIFQTVVRGFQQGLECVDCLLHVRNSVFSHFPSMDSDYVDGDNDGLYLRGGTVDISDSVVAGAKDDCIDTATSKNTKPGDVTIIRTLISHCLHEGIALSGSVDVARRIRVSDSTIQHSQQGVEMGYSPDILVAILSNVTFKYNVIAVRYGDNYNIPERGHLVLRHCKWIDNEDDIVNHVRVKRGPGKVSSLIIEDPVGIDPWALKRCE